MQLHLPTMTIAASVRLRSDRSFPNPYFDEHAAPASIAGISDICNQDGRLSLVARCAAIGLMQQRIADLPIFVLGCCELHSQKQAQLKVGAFEPQPSVYQN